MIPRKEVEFFIYIRLKRINKVGTRCKRAPAGGGDGPIAQDWTKNMIGTLDFGDLEALVRTKRLGTYNVEGSKRGINYKNLGEGKAKDWVEFINKERKVGEKIGGAVNQGSGGPATKSKKVLKDIVYKNSKDTLIFIENGGQGDTIEYTRKSDGRMTGTVKPVKND